MSSDFYLTVTQAKSAKEHSYQDAFANVPCDCCGQIKPVFHIVARYAGTELLSAYTTEEGIEGATAQAMKLFHVLSARIDAANLAWEEEEERKLTEAEEEATLTEADLVGDEG